MLPLYYIRWHYTQGVLDLLNIVGNFLWFFNELFSIRMSVRTFFVPFHRLSDDARPHGALDIGNLLERFLVNVLMRLVGALLHLTLIVLGIIFLAATALAGVLFLVIWLAAPLLLSVAAASGVALIVLS